MLKIVPVGSWPELSSDGIFVRRLPVLRSHKLGSYDAKRLLKQGTSTTEFLQKFSEIELQPGDIPLHMIALGATEGWGPNRNADGFREDTCRRCHSGFVKLARFYLRHINKDPARSYGIVKLSYYNEPMRRVELLILANGTPEAAQRHSGLVLPDRILQSIERGEDRAGSMSCTLAADCCVNCGKKARHRGEYCLEEECVNPETGRRGFGCRFGLGKISEDGFLQYVDNPPPLNWFDISDVTPHPADATAYGLKVPEHFFAKSSSGSACGGAELAEIVTEEMNQQIPEFLKFGWDLSGAGVELQAQQQWATKLAQLCYRNSSQLSRFGRPFAAEVFAVGSPDWEKILSTPGSDLSRSRLRKLAQQGVVLSLSDFAEWLKLDQRLVKSAAALLREPEFWLTISEHWSDLARNPYWDQQQSPATVPELPPLVLFSRSLEKSAVESRMLISECRPCTSMPLIIQEHPQVPYLARQFGLYKLAQLAMSGVEPSAASREANRLALLTILQIDAEVS